MRRSTHFVFRSVWEVQAPFVEVCTVLGDLSTYEAWWPEIREVRPLEAGRFELVARSLLPYELRFVGEQSPDDGGPGTIAARLSGDLEGFARWTVDDLGYACRLRYHQEVDTHKATLNALAPLARPAFRANHALMMRHGQAGLRTFMAGYLRGASG